MAGINLEQHRRQVEAYIGERPGYVTYAAVLKRVLEEACRGALPQALVQTRAKDVSSFAEKAARKFEKYHDPVHQLTDLCGGRVAVQTLEQVKAVRQFIEANFLILERDDKTLRLEEDRFGYRDMHYIVQLRADRDLGITAAERAAIGNRKAEIQVRTWVQHAWADTLHDRIYKTPLRMPTEVKRLGNLLSAVMEDGDRTFDRLATQIDGMLANYSAHAAREDVEKEVMVYSAVLANLPPPPAEQAAQRPELTLKLARLIARAYGDWGRVVELLEPLAGGDRRDADGMGEHRRDADATGGAGHLRQAVLVELGYALCRKHRQAWDSAGFRRGQALLQEALALPADGRVVMNVQKNRSLQAQGWSRLGWTWERVEERGGATMVSGRVLECYRKALELEPENPYFLAETLGYEMYAGARELPASARIAVGRAIGVCQGHALAGIEMPYACYTAGRLSVLLGDGAGALGWYALGLCHCRQTQVCVPADVVENELGFLRRQMAGPSAAAPWAEQLLLLAQARDGVAGGAASAVGAMERVKRVATPGASALAAPVLVVAGGAASLAAAQLEPLRAMLVAGLAAFRGTVISGGTTAGVPGCVGAAAAELAARGRKGFELLGYLPDRMPGDAQRDVRYDRIVGCGNSFSAEQVLRQWADVIVSGVAETDVMLLGIGGGAIAALEYRIALALGARVGLIDRSGGSAEALLADELWAGEGRLLPLPADGQTVRAFVDRGDAPVAEEVVEQMGREFHRRYLERRQKQVPAQMQPWEALEETFRRANRQQARSMIGMLEAAGLGVRRSTGTAFGGFTQAELEKLAEMEHGRWNVERLAAGWRHGALRDNARKVHPLIVAWEDKVLEPYRRDDYEAVKAMPEILAGAGLEVYRK